MDKIKSMLGLAKKAGKIVPGTDSVCEALSKGKVHLVFVASDASLATIDKMDKKCFFYHVNMKKMYTSLDIDQAIGMNNTKVIAIVDKGFADAIEKLCNEENN